MTYDGALVMPRNCVAMREDEMTYVEGGGKIPRAAVTIPIDILATALCPAFALIKYAGKAAAIATVKQFLPQLSGIIKKLVQLAIGATINMSTGTLGNFLLGNAWCFTSVGGIAGLAADYFSDGNADGWIRW